MYGDTLDAANKRISELEARLWEAAISAAAAALPIAAGVPTTAVAVDDPIFAAIDRHRRAEAAHLAAIEHERDGDWTIMEKSCHDENEAFGILVGAAATTVDGLFAKIEYLRDIATREAWMLDEREGTERDLIESFAGSIGDILGI